MRKIQLVDNTSPMLLDYKKPSEPDVRKLLNKIANTNIPIILDTERSNYFYCAECESKVRILPYFRTWCPCKDSSVVCTLYEAEYYGCAVSENDWKHMELFDAKIIFNPTTTPIER